MDADRRLTDEQADRALRALFLEAGHHRAPEGMDARILRRIVLMRAVKPERPLLPTPVLVSGALVCIAAFGWAASNGAIDIQWPWPAGEWSRVFGSPWLIAAGATAIGLLGIEALLGRKTYAAQGG